MGLAEYQKKRRFNNTPEPSGTASAKGARKQRAALQFVVQKHAASHLHYDFRLEMKGVLKSWAVPKGPSLNPDDKRLAMHVEDHPFDYKDFEGIIPKGNYGAGTVIIWDEGTYEPAEETSSVEEQEKLLLKAYHSGSLRLRMNGKKLKGEFALIKSKGREDNSWLLIKKGDSYASKQDVTKKDKSVVSNKTLEQIAIDKGAKEWISNRSASGKLKEEKTEVTTPKPRQKTTAASKKKTALQFLRSFTKNISTANKSAMPKDLRPMLATLTDKPFDDDEWIYEVKWDGYRALAYVTNEDADLRSRKNNSFNEKFFPVRNELKSLGLHAVIDGEVVVLDDKGRSHFGKLQDWTSEADGNLVYYVFDILWYEGYSLLHLTVTERRTILKAVLQERDVVRLSEEFHVKGTEFFEAAIKMNLEGIIAKKSDSSYLPDTRTKQWLKIKTEQRHEAVICGYTINEDTDKLFSALILGVYKNKKLTFIGHAGSGFTAKFQKQLLEKLKPYETKICPFPDPPVINKPTRFRPKPPKTTVQWVKPELVCEVRYQELSSEGIMRHASFQGLREDKDAKEVVG
jgi:bifunctional non-homologous end joining protein LigD